MTLYEDVKHITTEEYFNGNHFAIDAFKKKYALHPDESYVDALKRVCDFVASVETTAELRKYWSNRWFDEIYNDWWNPAGSVMQGAGSGRKVSLANCTTLSLGNINPDEEWDSLEAIIKNLSYEVAKSAAYRQGLGIDFSRLRPRNSKVLNSSNKSTGSVHWMQYIDNIANFVGQNGRRPAMLFSLSISHPDIEEFVSVKSDYTKIQNANISVQVTNDFYKAVENDAEWELHFDIPEIKIGDRVYIDVHSTTIDSKFDKEKKKWYYISSHNRPHEIITKKVMARKLLEHIARNMTDNAEPGIQNIDIARKYSNSDYVYDPDALHDSRITATNACSEQYLSRSSCCILSSLNLETFSTDKKEYEKELAIIGASINRFLDNVNECELCYKTYSSPHQRIAISALRRTGAGYTNIGAWLFKQGLIYGTNDANSAVEEFTKTYNYHLYKSSISIGEEKGNFELFNREKFIQSPFIKRMMKEFPDLQFDTMRNVTVSSLAPTGSLSTQFRNFIMSYGIEPSFGMYFWKRTRIAGYYEYYFCVPSVVRNVYEKSGYSIPIEADTIRDTWDGSRGVPIAEFIEKHKKDVGIHYVEAVDINPLDKLDLMSRVMKWIDSSISVTYMLPQKTDWKDVYNFILEAYRKDVKSIAAFPDKKMYGIVSQVPFKELAESLIADGVVIHPQNFTEDEQRVLGINDEKVHILEEKKRPKELQADIYSVTARGEKFCIAVGLFNGYPYEVFGGKMNGLDFKFSKKHGKITKVKRGVYRLEIGDELVVENFQEQFDPEEENLFRFLSTGLRYGVPLEIILNQLQKSNNDITSLPTATARVLRKYLKDGLVTGDKCPRCGNNLVHSDGCAECSCGYSKCS